MSDKDIAHNDPRQYFAEAVHKALQDGVKVHSATVTWVTVSDKPDGEPLMDQVFGVSLDAETPS